MPRRASLELLVEGTHQLRVVDHDQVLLIVMRGRPGPVVASRDEVIAIEDGELVVHVVGGRIDRDRDSELA